METALLAMMTGLLAMMAGVLLKMVDLASRVEAILKIWLRHTHDRHTGLPVAAVPAETD